MAVYIGHVVDVPDDARRVDEERAPFGDLGPAAARRSPDAVDLGDVTIDIGEQRERQLLIIGEGEVGARRIVRRADDGRTEIFERWASITEALGLDRSTGRRRLRVPPQHDPTTGEIGETHGAPVLIGQFERWRRSTNPGSGGGGHESDDLRG